MEFKFRLMCEGGCIYLSTRSKGAPPVPSKSVYMRGMVVIYQYYSMSHIDND